MWRREIPQGIYQDGFSFHNMYKYFLQVQSPFLSIFLVYQKDVFCTSGFGYLLPPRGTQASNSGYQRLKHHQPWLQAPWHTYPSHRLSSCYRESLWLRRKGVINPSGEGVMRPLRAVKCGPQGTGLATACRQEWWLSRKSSHASEAGSGLRRKHSAAPCTH